MRVYLDMCSIQRPLDAPDNVRVATEAQAVLGVLKLCESKTITLVGSPVLLYELERNPHPTRRDYASAVLANTRVFSAVSRSVANRARRYEAGGIRPLDALHLACAVEASADFFCTCDDRLLKRGRTTETGKTRVVSPIELILEVSP